MEQTHKPIPVLVQRYIEIPFGSGILQSGHVDGHFLFNIGISVGRGKYILIPEWAFLRLPVQPGFVRITISEEVQKAFEFKDYMPDGIETTIFLIEGIHIDGPDRKVLILKPL